jgi:CBS domain-containing protein
MMKCPLCGHENIAGADSCAECHASLTQDSNPTATTDAQHSIMTDRVGELYPRSPLTVAADASVADAIHVMLNGNVGCVLVTDDAGRLVGVFSESDVVRRVAGVMENPEEVPVTELMTPRPSTLPPDARIAHALHLMGLHDFRHVPLVDRDGRPVGVISSRDVVHFIEENFGV